jgi:hypothetical protein
VGASALFSDRGGISSWTGIASKELEADRRE